MKLRLIILLLCAVNLLSAQQKPTQKWLDQKYSMFIHFGLYSAYGGVYNGKRVEKGYSEQIQSFAGIFSDWYGNTAKEFNPTKWNADEIVALAKQARMRSIVITSKHHDGFCMYHSKYTKYNIVDATPYKRDLMKELADACKRGGVDFAVYYSLIDWNFPQAYPISSHNADPITPEHHEFNKKQVEEIMTNYGLISEIWFDMGSLTAEQSKELYEIVNRLQPQCMISGRLGNNQVDFSVMADNEYPDYQMVTPWQTAASMFNETWGYRSWQERGEVNVKAAEKLKSLAQVIGHGGNYLLNIGPKGDGSVVDFEREVLVKMGKWINRNQEAIYATQGNPLPESNQFCEITTKDNALYLHMCYPSKEIELKNISGTIDNLTILSNGKPVSYKQNKRNNSITVYYDTNNWTDDEFFPVLKLQFKGQYTIHPKNIVSSSKDNLTPENATAGFGHSSLDYYCGYKSLVSYTWNFLSRKKDFTPTIFFTENNIGKNLTLTTDEGSQNITLTPTSSKVVKPAPETLKWGSIYTKSGKGVFGTLEEEGQEVVDLNDNTGKEKWEKVKDFRYGEKLEMDLKRSGSVLFLQEIESTINQSIAVEVGGGNGVYILLNGKYITAHCLPEKPEYQKEIVILSLKKGKNQLLIKYFNRFADKLNYSLKPLDEWTIYEMKLSPFKLDSGHKHSFSIKEQNPDSKVSPLRMNNIEIVWK
ncbi:MAG TPA: hypothetical protein GXZ87_05750 [Bacteroidales bacterium]|nr:hypothetical protein [Bacteroidales bacterium]